MDEHNENWIGFPSELGDAPAYIKVDLGWAEEGEVPELPVRVIVGLSTKDVGEDGMEAFLQAIEPFDDALNDQFGPAINARMVGTIQNDVQRLWVFYAASREGAAEELLKLVPLCGGRKPQLGLEDDEEWEFYQAVLAPTAEQFRLYQDSLVVDQLVSNGDLSEESRQIDHWAYFPDEAASEKFVGWCNENGFTVNEVREDEEEPGARAVLFSHVGPATLEAIFERTVTANEAAADLGGDYDGWETEIVRGEEEGGAESEAEGEEK